MREANLEAGIHHEGLPEHAPMCGGLGGGVAGTCAHVSGYHWLRHGERCARWGLDGEEGLAVEAGKVANVRVCHVS